MYPIPFSFILQEQKEVEKRWAAPRPHRLDGRLLESTTRNPVRVKLDRLIQGFRQERSAPLAQDAKLNHCGQTSSCGECR